MKVYTSLRHNKQLLRMVRTEDPRSPYGLGNAYSDGMEPEDITERRRRIMDHWGIHSQSPRRPEPPSTAGILPPRTQRILFHELDQHSQELLSRRNFDGGENRRDVRSGTKQRIHRGSNEFELKVDSYTNMPSRPTKR